MLRQLLTVPILMEWVFLVTLAVPLALSGRTWTRKKPKLALLIWFSLFLSAGLSVAIATIISALVAFDAWLLMNSQPLGSADWLGALGVSFLPWIFLALGGIALASADRKFSPHFEVAREVSNSLQHLVVSHAFHGIPVAVIELPVKVGFVVKINGRETIVLGRGLIDSVSPTQLEAIKWHEIGHIRGRHNALKRIASFALSLAPFIRASVLFRQEVEVLCETDANNFASSRVSMDELITAHKLVSF